MLDLRIDYSIDRELIDWKDWYDFTWALTSATVPELEVSLLAFLYLSMVDFTLQYNDDHSRSQHTRLLTKIKAITRHNHMYRCAHGLQAVSEQYNALKMIQNHVLFLAGLMQSMDAMIWYVYSSFNFSSH